MKTLTHMVAVYIVIYYIFAGPIRVLCYFRRLPFSFKFIYIQIIKYLFNHFIIFK